MSEWLASERLKILPSTLSSFDLSQIFSKSSISALFEHFLGYSTPPKRFLWPQAVPRAPPRPWALIRHPWSWQPCSLMTVTYRFWGIWSLLVALGWVRLRHVHVEVRPRRPGHPPIILSCSLRPSQSHGSCRLAITVENGEHLPAAPNSSYSEIC